MKYTYKQIQEALNRLEEKFNALNEGQEELGRNVWWKARDPYDDPISPDDSTDNFYYCAYDLVAALDYADDDSQILFFTPRRSVNAAVLDEDLVVNELKYPEASYMFMTSESVPTMMAKIDSILEASKTADDVRKKCQKYVDDSWVARDLVESIDDIPNGWADLLSWMREIADRAVNKNYTNSFSVILEDVAALGYNAFVDHHGDIVFWGDKLFSDMRNGYDPLSVEEAKELVKNHLDEVNSGDIRTVLRAIRRVRRENGGK